MRDPATGLYTSDEHCGYCFNDCSTYYKPAIHHVSGKCIVSSGVASCGMGPCMTQTLNGQRYEWVNTDGVAANGCECRRIAGNTSNDNPEIVSSYASGYTFWDENCDGIDGVIGDAIFVSKDATSSGNGTINSPYKKISEALKAWPSAGKKYILVAEGVYEEDLTIPDGAVLHGGYSVNFHERDLVIHASTIRGVSADATIRAANLKQMAVISGFVIEGVSRKLVTGGTPSIAVWIQNTSMVSLYANSIRGGQGEPGIPGKAGAAGNGSKEDSALHGWTGTDSYRKPGPCRNDGQKGGSAGVNSKCPSANATPGGSTVCPYYNWSTMMGNREEYTSQSQNRGLGGYDGSFDGMSGFDCSHATESGLNSEILSDVGQDGLSGNAGSNGKAGRGGLNGYGTIRSGVWRSAPQAGAGANGGHGVAGGGGGAGGGFAYYHQTSADCPLYELGPTGGGGGAGGCGGTGGSGGGAGGASIGLLITFDRYVTDIPQVKGNVFSRGRGGEGGAGGVGGQGGSGGNGGDGGRAGYWISTKAGRGGDGGSGGRGGGGGGGAGGPSFDILGFNVQTDSMETANSFIYNDSIARGGTGGSGGIGGAMATGGTGVNGASRRRLDLRACGTNNSCATGTSCNSDNVCLPDK